MVRKVEIHAEVSGCCRFRFVQIKILGVGGVTMGVKIQFVIFKGKSFQTFFSKTILPEKNENYVKSFLCTLDLSLFKSQSPVGQV